MLICLGAVSNPVFNSSCAFAPNFSDDSSIDAWLWSMIYCNSCAGKAGESGRAIECVPRIERRVTREFVSTKFYVQWRFSLRTNIIVTVLYQKRNPVPVNGIAPGILEQPVLSLRNVS